METAIELVNVSKRYGSATVLDGIDLSVGRGTVLAVIGPSGAGKTTLLKCISALTQLDGGQILLNGEHSIGKEASGGELSKFRQKVGYVFQDFHLWPHKTVLENLCLAPVEVKRTLKERALLKAVGLLQRFELERKADQYPDSLSGGQKQRVAIARALAMEPQVMLMDEITSALDPELVGTVARIIRGLAKEGITVIVVTHDMDFAADVADEVVFLDGGKIVERGPPHQMLANPVHERTRAFLKATITE